MQNLNTQNPDFLTWTHEHIQFDILGGIRLEGLDRLRVALTRVKRFHYALTDNFLQIAS